MQSSFAEITELLKNTNSDRPLGRLLFYGIGNVGRQDDGLGIRLLETLEGLEQLPANVALQSNYQLNVEDALEISEFDVVIFVDATIEAKAQAPFQLRRIEPSAEIAFSTHAMTMEHILALADQFYGATPKAFVLTMPGYSWEIADELTTPAQANLEQTSAMLTEWLRMNF